MLKYGFHQMPFLYQKKDHAEYSAKNSCSITLSANAGISLQFADCQIWIDALHDKKVPGFSTVTPDLWEQMQKNAAFAAPDLICFTHCHNDHFSHALTSCAKTLWPQAKLILPEQKFQDQILLLGNEILYTVGDLSLRFIRLPHEGAQFAQVPHYGVLLSCGGFHVLLPGDCEVASPILERSLHGIALDLVLCDFPWVTQREGREFVQKILRPHHLLVYHLPFEQDELHRYRSASEYCVRRLQIPDIRLLMEPLQCEAFLY